MQYDKYKKACNLLSEIDKNPSNYLVIHYSCESFYDIENGRTPRITSLAVRYYDTGQTDSFSIHKTAEKKHITFEKIEESYNNLEKEMLSQFFKYVKEHKGYIWLHWNMRDINYGFKAIEHRFEVLGGKPHILDDKMKIDLSRLFIQKYGVRYIGHPRMENLLSLNKIRPREYLSGAEEANAFVNKEYIKLHQSTLRKVDIFANLLERAIQKTLLTNSKWKDMYGFSFQGIFEYSRNCWWIQLITWSITLLLGAIIGKILGI